MRYVESTIKRQGEEFAYRIYVTDSLKAIGHLDQRYYDFIKPVPQETRTKEEIISDISDKLNNLGRR